MHLLPNDSDSRFLSLSSRMQTSVSRFHVCLSAGSAGDGLHKRKEGYGDETLDYSTEGTPNINDPQTPGHRTLYRASQKISVV